MGPAYGGAIFLPYITGVVREVLTACKATDYDESITEKGGGPV